jgi:hypothetical protein
MPNRVSSKGPHDSHNPRKPDHLSKVLKEVIKAVKKATSKEDRFFQDPHLKNSRTLRGRIDLGGPDSLSKLKKRI